MEVSIIFKIGAVGILVSVSLPDTETQRERRTGLSCKPFRAIDRAVLGTAVYLSAF